VEHHPRPVRQGSTLLLTTQYLEEADVLADAIAVIDHGKVIAEGTSDELKDSVGARIEVVVQRANDAARAQHLLMDRSGDGVEYDDVQRRNCSP
jgi:ABC-2 type transport system ATP-binding protein